MRQILHFVVLAGLAVVVACSGEPSTGLPSANGKPSAQPSNGTPGPVSKAQAIAAYKSFAKCMRGRRQNMPDPVGDGQPNFELPAGASATAWRNAIDACQHNLPGGTIPRDDGPTAAELEQLRQFAICMRAHDIEMSDPATSGARKGDMIIGGRLEHVTRTELEKDPAYKAATAACKSKLPKGDQGKKGSKK